MNGNHIEFWTLETEDQIDRRHLADCPECQRKLELYRFLRLHSKNVPILQAPPFFAARVQALIGEARTSVIVYFERIAGRLAPLLTAVILATSFLIYTVSKKEEARMTVIEAYSPDMTPENVIGFTIDDEGSGK